MSRYENADSQRNAEKQVVVIMTHDSGPGHKIHLPRNLTNTINE